MIIMGGRGTTLNEFNESYGFFYTSNVFMVFWFFFFAFESSLVSAFRMHLLLARARLFERAENEQNSVTVIWSDSS